MKIEGTKLICDKCGIFDFTNQTFEVSGPTESDTFFTNASCMMPGWTRRHGKDLCPNCTKAYDDNIKTFFQRI